MDLKLFWETGDWVYLPEEKKKKKYKKRRSNDDDSDDVSWNSEDEDMDDSNWPTSTDDAKRKRKKVPREVEIMAGTRPIGTWIDVDHVVDDVSNDEGKAERREIVVRVEVGSRGTA